MNDRDRPTPTIQEQCDELVLFVRSGWLTPTQALAIFLRLTAHAPEPTNRPDHMTWGAEDITWTVEVL